MKKIIIALLVVSSILVMTSTTVKAKRSGEESIYPQTFIVTNIDRTNDIVYLETFTGMVYTWQGCEDWQINDIAAAIMYNSGTPETITDDQITVLEYSGWIE